VFSSPSQPSPPSVSAVHSAPSGSTPSIEAAQNRLHLRSRRHAHPPPARLALCLPKRLIPCNNFQWCVDWAEARVTLCPAVPATIASFTGEEVTSSQTKNGVATASSYILPYTSNITKFKSFYFAALFPLSRPFRIRRARPSPGFSTNFAYHINAGRLNFRRTPRLLGTLA